VRLARGERPCCVSGRLTHEPERPSSGAAARLAPVLFAGDAAIELLTPGLVPTDLHDREVIAAESVASALIALVLARLFPWQHWSFVAVL
jgi:hypothetical protein